MHAFAFKDSFQETMAVVAFFLLVLVIHNHGVEELPPTHIVFVYMVSFFLVNALFKSTYPRMSEVLLTSSVFYIGSILHKTFVHECSEEREKREKHKE